MKKKYYFLLLLLIILVLVIVFYKCLFISKNDNLATMTKTEEQEEIENSQNKDKKQKVVIKKTSKLDYKEFEKDNELAIPYVIDYDSDEDLDLDNLTNKEEKKYYTNPELSDSDLDGLDDDLEIFKYNTNPLEKDTDKDGLSDYDEIYFKLNPLKSSSYDDGILDGKRNLVYQDEINGVGVEITGSGDIASSYIIIDDNSSLSKPSGFLPSAYTIIKKGIINDFKVAIPYSLNDLLVRGINEEDLTIYGYDEETESYIEMESTVDKNNQVIYASLKDNLSYLVGDKKKVNKNNNTEILFLTDNSWSMYSNLQYKRITGKNYQNNDQNKLPGYDETGKRFNDLDNLINTFHNKKYLMGFSTFNSDYHNLFKIGSNKEEIKSKIFNIYEKNISESSNEISTALLKGLDEFSEDNNNKFLIIFTDGQEPSISKNIESIIRTAIKRKIRICPVIYGNDDSKKHLANLANATDCPFSLENDLNTLINLILGFTKNLPNDYIDLNNDGKKDGKVLANSGFLVQKNGFSFSNYSSSSSEYGHCYGMATIAELYYKEKLPLKVNKANKIYNYDFTNTYFNNYANLKDFRLVTSIMKYTFGFDYFNILPPYYFHKYNGKYYEIINPYRNEIKISGLYDLNIIDKKEKPILNDEKIQINNLINNEDRQILNAITLAHFKQLETPMYSSGTSLPKWLKIFQKDFNLIQTGSAGFINILITRLKDGDAPVIGGNFNNGLHAINAISLIQDLKDPEHYYIEVYDNNYPDENKYLDIYCNKHNCITNKNADYHNTNQTIHISPSLEYDLAYYNS